ncbi:hypothetical protein IFR05_012813 [Cadophora sp. M221]|nr:hypothetical protein IFR05_012813 [Cadophora sp. M221]
MEKATPLSKSPSLRRVDSGCDLGNLVEGLSLSFSEEGESFEELRQDYCEHPEFVVPPSIARLSDPTSHVRASIFSFEMSFPLQGDSKIIDSGEVLCGQQITQQSAPSSMDTHEIGGIHTSLPTSALASDGFGSDSDVHYFTGSEISFENFCESISHNPTSSKPPKATRYTPVNNPAGHRKYQKWIKTTALASLIESRKIKRVEGKREVQIVESPCV